MKTTYLLLLLSLCGCSVKHPVRAEWVSPTSSTLDMSTGQLTETCPDGYEIVPPKSTENADGSRTVDFRTDNCHLKAKP